MKKFALALTILSSLAALAYAGPEQYHASGKEMKEVVPVPTPCPTWAGFYIGGFGGYKYGNIDPNVDLGGFWDSEEPADRDGLQSLGSRDLNTSGAELGGLIGFNYQWHNWVFGAEAAGGYLWLRDSHSDELSGNLDPLVISSSFKTHYLFTFGPRIGYTFCRWMPYVTGGLAVGDLEFDQNIRFPLQADGTQQQMESFHQGGSERQTNAGWFVGAGLEYAITNHWRVRGQYQYIDLGSVDFNSSDVFTGDFTGHHDADLTEHNVSFAIIYGF